MSLTTQSAGGAITAQTLRTIQTLAACLLPTQGNIFFVNPANGDDNNPGTSDQPLKTLAQALSLATPNQNDTIFLCASSNAAGSTTDYQTQTLTWNKDLVHLIGINAGPLYSQRSRVAFFSSYAAAGPLFVVSANDCLIQNIEFFMGVASVLPIGCVKVTGERVVFRGCQIAGIGASTNDIAGAYSLNLSGCNECLLDDCTIGLDTIVRAAQANSEILVDTASTRCHFRKCRIVSMIGHVSNHPQVKLNGATAIDRTLIFEDCLFLNESINYAYAQASIFKLTAALTQGFVILNNPYANNSDNSTAAVWDVDTRNQIALFAPPTPAAVTAGVCKMV